MDINNLVFFNSNGDRIQTKIVDSVHIGFLGFDTVGSGLYSTNVITILEAVGYNGERVMSSPIIDANPGVLSVELQEEESQSNFGFFETSIQGELISPIFSRAITSEALPNPGYVDGLVSGIAYKIINNPPNGLANQFHVYLSGMVDSSNEDVVIIKYNNLTIARFDVYGDIESHDERLSITLSNLIGESLGQEESIIFSESDVKEELLDAIILNEKRKELLLEHSNIMPYLPSYIGLIRILKFFGYGDMRIKEHWMNLETSRQSLIKVDLLSPNKLEEPNYKTGYFSLFYDILSEVDDEFDEFGIPITQRLYKFSPKEILIKMFALKKWLISRGVGCGMISEIVGEASYYVRYDMRVWNDLVQTIEYYESTKTRISYKSLTNDHISDLRHLSTHEDVSPSINGDNYALSLDSILDVPISHFDGHNDIGQSEFRPDVINNEIGNAVVLSLDIDIHTWNNTNVSWNQFNSNVINITWDNIHYANYYNILWCVRLQGHGGLVYEYQNLTKPQDGFDHRLDLPYGGVYDVEVTLYGYNDLAIKTVEKSLIITSLYPLSMISYHNIIDDKIQGWENPLSWFDMADNNFMESFKFWDNNQFYGSVDYHNINPSSVLQSGFVETLVDFPDGFGIRPQTWNDSMAVVSWNELSWNSWNGLKFEQLHDRIIITSINVGSTLYINSNSYVIPGSATDLTLIASHLNGIDDSEISKLHFTARPIENPSWLDCVTIDPLDERFYAIGGLNMSVQSDDPILWNNTNHSLFDLGFDWQSSVNNHRISKNIPQRYSYTNMRVSNDVVEIPMASPVVVSLDTSGMAGIDMSKTRWILKRRNPLQNESIDYLVVDYKFFMYSFHEDGIYDLEVVVIDNNGNKSSFNMKKFIVKSNYVEDY